MYQTTFLFTFNIDSLNKTYLMRLIRTWKPILVLCCFFSFTVLKAQDKMPDDIQQLWNQANTFQQQKAYQKASDTYTKALGIFLPQKNHAQYQLILARLYFGVGVNNSPNHLAKFPVFYEYMVKAAQAIRQTNDTQYKPEILYQAGIAYYYYRQYDKSLLMTEESLKLLKANSDLMTEANVSGLMGRLYMAKAQYDEALAYFERSTRIIEKFPDKKNVLAHSYFNLALLYQTISKRELAVMYHKRSIETYKEFYGDDSEAFRLISGYYFLADLYVVLENPKEARHYMEKVFEADGPNVRKQRGGHYYLKGRILHLEKKYKEAVKAYRIAIKLQEKLFGPDPMENSEIYRMMSDSYRDDKQFDLAFETIQKTLILNNHQFSSKDVSQSPSMAGVVSKETQTFALAGKAAVWKAKYDHSANLNDLKKSLEVYRFVLKQIKEWRLSQENENNLLIVLQYSRFIFVEAIEVLHELHRKTNNIAYIQEAFDIAEQNKSYVLLRSLHLTSQSNRQGVSKFERDLSEKIAKTKEALQAAEGLPKPNKQQINTLKDQAFALIASRDSLQNVYKRISPEYYRTKYKFEIASAQAIQQGLLTPEQTLIEYVLGEEQLFIFTISQNNLSLKQVKLPQNFEANIKALRNSITDKNFQEFARLGYYFYELLMKDLPIPKPTQKLWVVPDGILYYLPWETLLTAPYQQKNVNYRNLAYLLKKYIVSYDYSANLIYSKRTLPLRLEKEKLLAFSPDFKTQLAVNNTDNRDKLRDDLSELKGAKEEVKALDAIYSGQLFLGRQATEYEFRNNLQNGSVLHLATHAIVDDERPAYSRLLFSLSNKDTLNDGYLHAYELYNLKLNAELVTLSACNTGFGKIQSGEGVMSLGRAFAYAGSPNVLMSLWSVPDKSTSQIMIEFYKNLANGMPKDIALQQAKLAYIESADNITTNPFYWSSFVLIGDPKPLSLQPQTPFYMKSMFLWLMGVLLLGGGVWMLTRKQIG
ncbi:hypothetical protein BKI52_23805 [marine bacterium AO1-C]|nr:hypothetical protein BKI52_23805 [marine bacterium AO1-C]